MEQVDINYDTNDQSIVFMNNARILVLTNVEDVDTIYTRNKKFIPIKKTMYELLDIRDKLAILVSYSNKATRLEATADHSGGIKETDSKVSNTVSDIYTLRNYKKSSQYELVKNYWIYEGTEIKALNKEEQLVKFFPEKAESIKKFIAANHLNLKKEMNMTWLLNFLKAE